MTYSRLARLQAEQAMKQEKRKYSIRKVSTIGATSALIGSLVFISTQAKHLRFLLRHKPHSAHRRTEITN